ncbi:SCO family protein [Microbulbifer sp. THAF38]|uniref:SCO family protein n=1 Tax=Microbulbifer sp. THAF38 TaxID=2587856 RepID=UPI001267DF56|nr:SCO family protein [Microbulbifer sp. THAF38]QFT53011.1 SCO1/SenC family protein [Microbulbifer sp. THAF38]
MRNKNYKEVEPVLDQQQKRGVRITIAVLLMFIVAVLVGFVHKLSQPRIISDSELRLNGAVKLQRARILDNFKLIKDSGDRFETSSLKGQWTLVFFGFSHCPDVCPTTLSSLNSFYQMLDEDIRTDTNIILVTVDPARDKPKILHDYVRYFNKDFRGITGDFIEIKRFASQLNVPFNKVNLDNGEYTVDHGSQVVLINPLGHYHAFFRAPLDPAKMKLTYRSIRATFEG